MHQGFCKNNFSFHFFLFSFFLVEVGSTDILLEKEDMKYPPHTSPNQNNLIWKEKEEVRFPLFQNKKFHFSF